jgi:hypothetical protein
MQIPNQNIAQPDRDCTLVIMAKAPRIGAVKTRLAECLSPSAIIELYRCLLEDTVTLAHSLTGVETAMMCPAPDVEELSHSFGNTLRVVAQTGEGLGAALTSVFAHFTEGRRRVVAFNSDSPQLPASVLQSAFDALASSDLVVGSTEDGGYYLVGATTSHPGLFNAGAMGTTNALDALLANARSLGLSLHFTDTFYDVDVAADLHRLEADLHLSPEKARRTAEWFAKRAATAKPRASSMDL